MSLDRPLVSVIVPVYKVEKYIKKCVQSIINQTYRNIEIVLVDDGSPDQCPAICDEFALVDKRIVTIHKTNGGQSDARNVGMQVAHGDYFAFVDSDDWIEDNLIEIALRKIEENDVDIVSFAANIIVDEKAVKKEFAYFERETILSSIEATEENLKDSIGSQPCFRLYRASCWDGISFPSGRIYEDIATLYKVFENARKGICFIPDALYNYRRNFEGTSLSASPYRAYHIYLSLKEHYEYAKRHYPHVSDDCLKMAVISGMSVINISLDSSTGFEPVGVDDVRRFMHDNKKCIQQLKNFTHVRRLMILIYYSSFSIYKVAAKLTIWYRNRINWLRK